MHASPSCPGPAIVSRGLEKRMMGRALTALVAAQPIQPGARRKERVCERERAHVGASAPSKPHRSELGEIIPEIKSWARSLQDLCS